MLKQWEWDLIDCRAAKDWDAANDLIAQVMATASGAELGRAKLQAGFTLYAESAEHTPRALELTTQALALAEDDYDLRARGCFHGIMYCLYTTDSSALRDFVTQARQVVALKRPDALPWLARLRTWQGYYHQTVGGHQSALACFEDSARWAQRKLSLHGTADDLCLLRIARTAAGESLLAMGRTVEALRSLHGALMVATQGAGASVSYLRGRIAHVNGQLDQAEEYLRLALDQAPDRDHLFRLRAVEALAYVLRDAVRAGEIGVLLQPYRVAAKRGWMTRVLIRLQRLAV